MKRALLIIAGLLITTCFSIYIFEIDLFGKDDFIGYQEDAPTARINQSLNIPVKRSIDIVDFDTVNTDTVNTDTVNTDTVKTDTVKTDTVKTDTVDHDAVNSDIASTVAVNPDIVSTYTVNAEASQGISPEGWELTWSDEFEKKNLDIENWTEIDRKNNYNHELQYYVPDNSYIENGCLYLNAKKEKKSGKKYTSAMVETRNKFAVRYGRVEVRAKLPVGEGLFPAIWMLSDDSLSEIDIMEMIGSEPNLIYGGNHYYDRKRKKFFGMTNCDTPDEFHVYAMEWEEDEIRWYMDGELFHKSTKGVSSDSMYIVLDLAVGGDWPGDPNNKTSFPCSMIVDYIRVFSR